MKIAVTSAVSWPYVRRGSRCAYELAVYLAGQGHDVTFITTKPGDLTRKRVEKGMKVEYHRLKRKPLLTLVAFQPLETFFLPCLRLLLKGDFDIVQTTFPVDAFAASLNRNLKGTPFVHLIYDCNPLHLPSPWGKPVFGHVVKTASRLVSVSNFVNRKLHGEYGHTGEEIPLMVDTSCFLQCDHKSLSSPRILCTASLLEKRKRVDLLVRAFEKLLMEVPGAILQLCGHTTQKKNEELLLQVSPETRKSIQILSVGRTFGDDLPALYRQAAITVLPSINEAFGMVQTESLASGTPVVATRSGACPEILDDPKVGVLFEQEAGPGEVCRALLKGLELARDPETPARCRGHAERYSWELVGSRYEKLYEEILSNDKSNGARARRPRDLVITAAEPPGNTVSSAAYPRPSSRERLFLDALDAQDIAYDVYGAADILRPRCLSVMTLLERWGVHQGAALVAAPFPLPFSMVLKELGFSVLEQDIQQKNEGWERIADQVQTSEWAKLKDLSGPFDLILCDDLLQHLHSPVKAIKLLARKLNPTGILLLTTPNATRGSSRLRLFAGKNIYPWPEEELGCGEGGRAGRKVMPFREYTGKEVKSLVVSAGLTYLDGRTILGKQPAISHWYPLSLSSYLIRQGYGLAQKLFPPIRSYLLVAATNPLPGTAPWDL